MIVSQTDCWLTGVWVIDPYTPICVDVPYGDTRRFFALTAEGDERKKFAEMFEKSGHALPVRITIETIE